MNIKPITTIGLAMVMLVGITYADTDPNNAIKYRKNIMGAVGAHTGALVAILKAEVPHTEALKTHSAGLVAATTPSVVLAAFTQNTHGEGSEETTATAKIWEDWARYEEAVNDLHAAAKEIQAAADSDSLTSFDQLKPALMQCGFCHRESGFRDKK